MPTTNCNFYLVDMLVRDSQLDLAPGTVDACRALARSRLDYLDSVASWVQTNHATSGNKVVIVAPESFLGIFAYTVRGSQPATGFPHLSWETLVERMDTLKARYPGFIFAPGTAIRGRNGRGISTSLVGSSTGSNLTVFKSAAGGPVDGTHGMASGWDESMWTGQQKLRLSDTEEQWVNLGPAETSRVYREPDSTFRFGAMICTDARHRPLHCDPFIGIPRGTQAKLPMVVWMTFGLFLEGARGGYNAVERSFFPLDHQGVLVQCGAGAGRDEAWVKPGQDRADAQGTFGRGEQTPCERLMVRTRELNRTFTAHPPAGWFTPTATHAHLKKVVYWTDIPVVH